MTASALGANPFVATQAADTATAGLVTSGQQSFGGLKKFEGGLIQVGINVATDADATLDNTSSRHITYTGFTASRNITLPTTGIVSGEVFTLVNTNLFDLVVKSSNGSALTVANSANMDATIQKGYVVLKATQATPTTPAHWRVIDVYEEYAPITGTTSGAISAGYEIRPRRQNKLIMIKMASAPATASASSNFVLAGPIPTRMKTTQNYQCVAISVINNNGNIVGSALFRNDTGAIEVRKYDASNFSGSCGLYNAGGGLGDDGTTACYSTV